MRKFIYIISFFFSAQFALAQEVPTLLFKDILKKVENTEGLVILNVWATWCKPCVAELPHFQKVQDSLRSQGVHIIIASADFDTQIPNIKPFLEKRSLTLDACHIKDGGESGWIDLFDPSFSGAIPATAFYLNGKKVLFHEGDFKEEELFKIVNEILKQK